MKRSLLLAVAVLVLMVSPVMAKEGFYLGAFVPTNTVSGAAGTNVDSETGWGLRVGKGFNRYLALEANYSKTKDLTGFAGDVKLNFPLTTLDSAQVMSVEPYLLFGFGHYEMSNTYKAKSDGAQWGFGVELYLFRELSVHAGWTRTAVSFDTTPNLNGDVKTVDFGVIYHFL